ncbi:MAG: hypothetical protein JJU26_12865 [Oceanicaulis sp.]|uniref:hypothetical protein n=1 Tax=Glycocaulis sp. TaxID=1969725 RepID=UPI0025B80226|nr:hypothetical protein [Glycocaulis sp.]MCC5982596.1 hypothetical protein [Oceanicaulis sp.]MCH8522409.1 hypothetical protein [Glycocaulis sp.]
MTKLKKAPLMLPQIFLAAKRVVKPIAALVLFASISAVTALWISGQIIQGSQLVGISSDEGIHLGRTANWFRTGWYLPPRFLDENHNAREVNPPGRIHAYGPSFSVSAHVFNVALGREEFGRISRSPEAFDGRRLFTALLGIVASVAFGFSLYSATGSRMIGLWSGAALLAVPAWAGYAMFHPKDLPVAAGLTFFVAGMVIAFSGKKSRHALIFAGLLCLIGVYFSVGTRTALWVYCASAFILILLTIPFLITRPTIEAVLAPIIGSIAGFALVMALQYRNMAQFADWLIGSVFVSVAFPAAQRRTTLTAGIPVSWHNPDWWYLPAWMGTAIPTFILLISLFGMIWAFWSTIIRARNVATKQESWRFLSRTHIAALLFGQLAFMLPVAAIIMNSTMYGGVRQHLYAVPGLVGLAGIGMYILVINKNIIKNTWVLPLMALPLLFSAYEQSKLHPFNYIYRNTLAGPVDGRRETDMHGVGDRIGAEQTPEGIDIFCTRRQANRANRCAGALQWISERPRFDESLHPPIAEGNVLLVMRPMAMYSAPNECSLWQDVTRPLRQEHIVVVRVFECPADQIVLRRRRR